MTRGRATAYFPPSCSIASGDGVRERGRNRRRKQPRAPRHAPYEPAARRSNQRSVLGTYALNLKSITSPPRRQIATSSTRCTRTAARLGPEYIPLRTTVSLSALTYYALPIDTIHNTWPIGTFQPRAYTYVRE